MIRHSIRLAPDWAERETKGRHDNYIVYTEDTRTLCGCRSEYVSKAEAADILSMLPVFSDKMSEQAAHEAIEDCKVFYGLRKRIGRWYRNTFPTDEMGSLIGTATFQDLFDALDYRQDVYKVIFGGGHSDSLVRERCFSKLAEIIGTDYGYIYDQWLSSARV